jgi:uncharacterized protein (DUF1501 family)
MKSSRRDILQHIACGLLGKAAFISGFDRFSAISAYAAPINPTDYKALVCIFLFGGNDSNNTVISLDRYADYAAARGGLAIAEAQLLPLQPPVHGGRFGIHPSLGPLHALFLQKKVALVCNVGTLTAPITKAEYQAGMRPYQLFSHSDQQNQWQTSVSVGKAPSGWGGRMADATQDAATGFPTITSIAGVPIFTVGARTAPVTIGAAPTPLNQTLRLIQNDAAIVSILRAAQGANGSMAPWPLVRASASVTAQALNNSSLLGTDPVINTVFPNTGVANQLRQVAKVIKLSSTLGIRRQIFFCSLGGFDTHNGQIATQSNLLGQLAAAMSAFYNATVELGVSSKVTTFTLSDFNRTFKPAATGQTAIGSDHAWGGHHFIMGDAVAGGEFYGVYPDLTMGGPQDTDSGTAPRGRWIPTAAVDQYAATLALWYGFPSTDLPLVFPNIGRFATYNLGFMSA